MFQVFWMPKEYLLQTLIYLYKNKNLLPRLTYIKLLTAVPHFTVIFIFKYVLGKCKYMDVNSDPAVFNL